MRDSGELRGDFYEIEIPSPPFPTPSYSCDRVNEVVLVRRVVPAFGFFVFPIFRDMHLLRTHRLHSTRDRNFSLIRFFFPFFLFFFLSFSLPFSLSVRRYSWQGKDISLDTQPESKPEISVRYFLIDEMNRSYFILLTIARFDD